MRIPLLTEIKFKRPTAKILIISALNSEAAVGHYLYVEDCVKSLRSEVVLLFRPECSPVKVDQGFTSGCHFHGFRFAGMNLFGGQYAMGRVGPLGVVIGQPFPNTVSGL